MNAPADPRLLQLSDGLPDADPTETAEWREAFESLV